MKKPVCLIFILLAISNFSLSCFAQDKILSSFVVVDAKGKFPLPGVTVLEKKGSVTVSINVTDSVGRSQFNIHKLSDSLYFSLVGYNSFIKIIDTLDISINDTILLFNANYQLRDIIVNAKRSQIEQTPEGYVFSVQNRSRIANGNARQLIQTLPGIIPTQTGGLRLFNRPVSIWIDGKPSRMGGSELDQFLSSLSLNDVKEIRVLANPSAEYDGNAGSIIDIVLKKQILDGILVNIDGYLGSHDKYGLNSSIDFKSKGYTGKYKIGYNHNNLFFKNKYNQFNKSSNSYYDFISENQDRPTDLISLSLDNNVLVNEKSTLGFLFRYSEHNLLSNKSLSELIVRDEIGEILENTNTTRDERALSSTYFANTSFRHNFSKSGTNLSIEGFYWKKDQNNRFGFSERGTTSLSVAHDSLHNYATQELELYGINTKYNMPLSKRLNMSIGALYNRFIIEGNFKSNRFQSKDDLLYSSKNESFLQDYIDNVYATYVNFTFRGKKLRFISGIRIEGNTQEIRTTNISQGSLNNKNFGLYPNLSFTYSLNKIHSFKAGYNRKIWRISYSQLNPINMSSDFRTIYAGNPKLTPTDVNSFNFQYDLSTSVPFSFTFSHIIEKNPYTWIILPSEIEGQYIHSPLNYDRSNSYNLNIYTQSQIGKNLFSGLNVGSSLDYMNIKSIGLENPSQRLDIRAAVTLVYSFPKDYVLQVFGNFKTRSISALGSMGNYQYIDITMGKSFKNGLTLNFAANDIFNLNSFKYINNSEFLWNEGVNKDETRIFRLTLSYKFGKEKNNKIKDFNVFDDNRIEN